MLQVCPARGLGGGGRGDGGTVFVYVCLAQLLLTIKPFNVTILSRAGAGRGWARGEWNCFGLFFELGFC